ncbi:MAG: hypothetical protein ACOZAQ_06195 [Pseudomonadota bacterium]
MKGYPAGFPRLLYMTLVALFVSGLALAPNALDTRLELNVEWWSLGSGTRVWVAAAHAASVFIMLTLLGALWTIHMRAGWIRRENVVAGLILVTAFALLAISGLLLYYAGDELTGQIALGLHLFAGLTLPAWLAAHFIGAIGAKRRCHLRQP